MKFQKYIVGILLLLVFFSGIRAQQTVAEHYHEIDLMPLHFGYTIGLNTMDFVTYTTQASYNDHQIRAEVRTLQPGFHVGMVSDFRLNRYLSVRCLPGMSFGSREITFWSDKDSSLNKELVFPYYPLKIPLLIKYKADRINNYRPYIIGGVNFHYDFSNSYEGYIKPSGEVYPLIRFKRFDVLYEIGFGIDSYFEDFKLSTEIKYCVGIRDVLNHELGKGIVGREEIYTNMFEKVISNQIMLSFHFE